MSVVIATNASGTTVTQMYRALPVLMMIVVPTAISVVMYTRSAMRPQNSRADVEKMP